MNKILKRCSADPLTGCLVWQGCKIGHGYGQIRYKKKRFVVHRLVWELAKGSIPKGLELCHACDNPACVRLDHLFLGTHLDNMRDCKQKGRYNAPKGENAYQAKLTNEIVRRARQKHLEGQTITSLAKQFGVKMSTMQEAIKGRTWRHVT